jgi:CxxC-x17-CxxC domain-containing protein
MHIQAQNKKRKYKMYREGNRGGRFDGPPREMHKVTCAECGKETEVPFKPDGTRPVYCRDCYQNHRPKRF